MKALEFGLVADALDLEIIAYSATVDVKGSSALIMIQDVIAESVKRHLKESLDKLDNKKESKKFANGMNVIELRKKIIKEFMKNKLSFKAKKCVHCGAPKRSVRIEYNSRIYLKGLSSRQATSWGAVSRVTDLDENPAQTAKSSQSTSRSSHNDSYELDDDDDEWSDEENTG